jgi:hypothetical protein
MITAAIFIVCLFLALVLLAFGSRKPEVIPATHEQVAKALEDFIEDKGGDHDWDDFLHSPIKDSFLESVRKRCEDVFDEYPAKEKGFYCSDEGMRVLRGLLDEVRAKGHSLNPSGGRVPPGGLGWRGVSVP